MNRQLKIKKLEIVAGLLASFVCLALCSGCEPEPLVTAFPYDAEETKAAVISLSVSQQGADTKASVLDGCEAAGSGCTVLTFDGTTGALLQVNSFSQAQISGGAVEMSVRTLADVDFYVLGNLNFISTDGLSRVADFKTAMGDALPLTESELESFAYRLDGGTQNASYRREKYSEVALYGIPYSLKREGVNVVNVVNAGGSLSFECRRLFSRIDITIDHSGLDGGADADYFKNSKLYVRQANCRLTPFSAADMKAETASDTLSESDYDPSMSNASTMTFSFYVPENMQGTLLPSITDNMSKTPAALTAAGVSAAKLKCLTYIEFTGNVSASAGGYGGDVTYKFYLGGDAFTNFDVERSRIYGITLSFNAGSLFEPSWKVDGTLSDGRLFCLTQDAANTNALPDAQTLVVRKNRNGKAYLYMNVGGAVGAANALLGKDVRDAGWTDLQDLRDCGWTSDFLSKTNVPSEVPKAAALSDLGIMPSYDKASGLLSFSVTDPSKFSTGHTVNLSLTLLPTGATRTLVLKTYEDITVTVADGKSLTDDFYLAQKRSVTISGLYGSNITYRADAGNKQWKLTNSLTDPFPGVASQDLASTSFDIYAFYPSKFLNGHGTDVSRKLYVATDDILNDSGAACEITISEPYYQGYGSYMNCEIINIDGNEVQLRHPYQSFDKSVELDPALFDETLYREYLALPVSFDASSSPYLEALYLDPFKDKIFVKNSYPSAGKLETLTYTDIDVNGYGTCRCFSAGDYVYKVNPSSGLFSYYSPTGYIRSYYTKAYFGTFGLATSLTDYEDGTGCFVHYTGGGQPIDADGNPVIKVSEYFNYSARKVIKYKGTIENVHGDNSLIEGLALSGEKITYTCQNSSEVIEPVIDLEIDGNAIMWVYDSARQKTQSASGEKVPGSLCVPYGVQKATITSGNKWDGRKWETTADGGSIYHYVAAAQFLLATTASANAKIIFTSVRNAAVLTNLYPGVGNNAKSWISKCMGSSGWGAYLRSGPKDFESSSYDGISGYQYDLETIPYKTNYAFGSSSPWTNAGAKQAYESASIFWFQSLDWVSKDYHILTGNNYFNRVDVTKTKYLILRIGSESMSKAGYGCSSSSFLP